MNKSQNKALLLVKAGLWLIPCWLASFVIVTFFATLYFKYGTVMCFLFGFCSLGATLCIYADVCHKTGGRMNTKSMKIMGENNNDQHFGALMGAVPTGINYIFVIILYLSKFGIIKADMFGVYKTLTLYFMPFTYIFAPNTLVYLDNGLVDTKNIPACNLGPGMLILALIMPLCFLVTCWAAFYIGYNHIDMKELILYGGKREK